MSVFSLVLMLVACGGEAPPEAKPAPAPAAAPPVAAPVAPPPPVEAAAPTGPYTPNEFAAKAYEAAKAAKSDGPNPKSGDEAAIAAGKTVYEKCVACHGATGSADTPTAKALPQKPSNFHHKERWDATSAGVKFWIVKNGVQGTGMAPLGLSDDESWQVLAYIESAFVGK